MKRDRDSALRWMRSGYEVFARGVQCFDEVDFSAPSGLSGWNRRQLVGHVAGNAEALTNLLTWAATGVETPMYPSANARADGIARAADMTGADLRGWLARATAQFDGVVEGLTAEQWEHEVRTVQGRTLPATEIPWLRSREVMVHAVDLDCGIEFSLLPGEFIVALIEDIAGWRGMTELPEGPDHEVAAWLAGRGHGLDEAPLLGPWL